MNGVPAEFQYSNVRFITFSWFFLVCFLSIDDRLVGGRFSVGDNAKNKSHEKRTNQQ